MPDLDLAGWAGEHRSMVETQLYRYGAILLRGFPVQSLADFQRFAQAVSNSLIQYGERSSPRTELARGVYTSTDHPPDQPIVLHSEQSYTLNWPMKIMFCCLVRARKRGNTPFADCRAVLARLDKRLLAQFAEKGVMYVRNYNAGLGLPWQAVFQTTDRAMVEAHCRAADIEFEWRADDRLTTRQVRPALRTHPKTGETVWFNHAVLFHATSLEPSLRDSLQHAVGHDEFPFNTFYGDGSPIEGAVLDQLRAAYDSETVTFPWQEGDVLVLDNMLTAHGREPYVGPRTVVTAMADPYLDETRAGGGRHE